MASPAKKSVQLFYDVVSPFSWIAFEVGELKKNFFEICILSIIAGKGFSV